MVVVGAAVTIVIGLFSLVTTPPGRDSRRPVRTIPALYKGDFRYAAIGTERVWCVTEYIFVPDDALAYLIRPAPRAPGAQSAPSASALPPDPPCPGDLGDGDVERAPQPTGVLSLRVRDLLGHEWVYEGPRGVDAFPDHVYRRMRVEKLVLQRRNSSSKVAINEVVLPQIAVGAARLVPGDESTIRFQAPKGVLRATSPPARPDDFADDTSFTVSLGELAKVGGNPRVAFVSETPRRSQGSRATVWFGRALTNLVGWITSLLGVAVATTVTVIVGIVIERRWRGARPSDIPEEPVLVLPDGTPASRDSPDRSRERPARRRRARR